ncbi:MAG: hypothetical protein CVV07_07385 [Gammaproteobacteria bacterium HGW-Gammaproteobacteria-11]|nr:MAG: hypothetical protein CVV07_07385 [Gammaproteobacteria bacterium HGW-Gammaproteobacteria-11]
MTQLYTQLFRGITEVANYPGHNYEEIFKLQNVSAEPETTEILVNNPTRIGQPELDGVTSTTAINVVGEAVDFSPRAAAIALYGSVERVPSGSAVEEPHDAYVGGTMLTAHIPMEVTALTSEDGETEYEPGEDYALTYGGIRVLDGGALAAAIAAVTPVPGQQNRLPVLISYAYPTVDLIKPFTQGRKYFRVAFSQINEGGANERRRVKCHYARISLNGGMPLNQGAEFGVIPVSIRLLSDPNIFEPGEAAIWQIEHQAVEA